MNEYKPPKPPVEVNQEISISNEKDVPSVFGDEDALLSVASEAYEVSTTGRSSTGSATTNGTGECLLFHVVFIIIFFFFHSFLLHLLYLRL